MSDDYDDYYKAVINQYKCGGKDGKEGGWAGLSLQNRLRF